MVEPGEFVTLLGPSGSSKTTTMMMVAGFEEHTSGSVLIDGKPVASLPPRDRDLGVVFQNYALFPHMSAPKTWSSRSGCARCPRPNGDNAPIARWNAWAWARWTTASHASSPAGSSSVWPWPAPWCSTPPHFS
ncbi:ABC-type multidrug transport system ATPase subunit [Arthrobacter sp. UYEF6]